MNSKQLCSLLVFLGKAAAKTGFAVPLFLVYLVYTVGMMPLLAISIPPTALPPKLPATPNPGVDLLAQQGDYLVFGTADYSVRVFNTGNGIRMNVFDRTNDILRLDTAPVTFTVEGGNSVYVSTGSYSANTATYKASVSIDNEVSLIIEIGADRIIRQVAAPNTATINLPPEQQPQSITDTRLAFETSTYAVRVFRRDDNLFMNVYNRFSGASALNGVAANLANPEPPYDCAVSYTAGGEQNGIPVRYFARIDGSGGTVLEIYNINNQRMFQEAGVGPVTINIPQSDLPSCIGDIGDSVSSPYIAAVFGNNDTLNAVQQLYPDARMEDSRLGSYINVGEFPNRDLALERVFRLRGLGFTARVIYRDVRFR